MKAFLFVGCGSASLTSVGIMSRLNTKGTLLQFTVHRGSLAKTFYVIDRTPNLTLQVRNEFNCFEHIHLTCVTKHKLDLDRSTVTCLGTSTFYDDKSAYEYEVESAMLTEEEASHYSQLILSQYTNIIEPGGGSVLIITDISGEISDADNATNSIKFKYKYATHRLPCSVKSPHISTLRKIIDSTEPIDIRLWTRSGEIQHWTRCITLKYDFYKGTRRMKMLDSNQIRQLRDVCIFEISGIEVYMWKKMITFAT